MRPMAPSVNFKGSLFLKTQECSGGDKRGPIAWYLSPWLKRHRATRRVNKYSVCAGVPCASLRPGIVGAGLSFLDCGPRFGSLS